MHSSGSSGQVRGAEKHEIYAAAFGSHLFYDLFSQGWGGGHAPLAPSGSTTVALQLETFRFIKCYGRFTLKINWFACFALVSGGRSFSPPRPLSAPWPPRWRTFPSTSNASLTWRTCHSSYLGSTREGATSSAKQRTSSQKTFQNLIISSYEKPPCKTLLKIVVAICKE